MVVQCSQLSNLRVKASVLLVKHWTRKVSLSRHCSLHFVLRLVNLTVKNCRLSVSKVSALETNGKQFLFVGPHTASSWTSTGQTLHLAKAVAASCVGLALSPLTDSPASGVVCFACPWKRCLCLQAPWILLFELTRSCGLDLDCFRIASLSLAHRAQFLVAKVLPALTGSPCQMMLQLVSQRWLVGDGLMSQN